MCGRDGLIFIGVNNIHTPQLTCPSPMSYSKLLVLNERIDTVYLWMELCKCYFWEFLIFCENYFRETLTELEAHLHKLEEDHKNKQLALSLDSRFKFKLLFMIFMHSNKNIFLQINDQWLIKISFCNLMINDWMKIPRYWNWQHLSY